MRHVLRAEEGKPSPPVTLLDETNPIPGSPIPASASIHNCAAASGQPGNTMPRPSATLCNKTNPIPNREIAKRTKRTQFPGHQFPSAHQSGSHGGHNAVMESPRRETTENNPPAATGTSCLSPNLTGRRLCPRAVRPSEVLCDKTNPIPGPPTPVRNRPRRPRPEHPAGPHPWIPLSQPLARQLPQ